MPYHFCHARDWNRRPKRAVNIGLQDALFNDIDAPRQISKEKPVHRQILELARQGYQQKEIARAVGMTPYYVGTVLRQPWAREYMINRIKQDSKDEFKRLLEDEGLRSFKKMTELRDGATSEAVRADMSKAIVERWLGKPVQPIDQTVTGKKLEELSDSELASIIQRGPGSDSSEGV